MEGEIEGRELALKLLIEYEKNSSALKESLRYYKGDSVNKNVQKAYDYFYGTLRLLMRLDYILGKHLQKYNLSDLPLPIRNILRLGVYGLTCSGDPDYAVVDNYVSLARKYGHNGTASLVNGVLRNLHPVRYPEGRIEYLSIFYSLPMWLVRKLLDAYGDGCEKILEESNKPPRISIRVNRLKKKVSELQKVLKKEGVETEKSEISDYNLFTDGAVLYTNAFKDGLFQVQSIPQTLFTLLLSPKRGEVILDLCSSPGGKSTGIAEIMGDKGMILSVDIKNLDKVVSNCLRLGLRSVYPIKADVRDFSVSRADRIMLDVPCSGTGVMAKRADLRWNIKPESLGSLKSLQLELLNNAARNLSTGGVLVYATCSILPEENEEQVYRFLKDNTDFELEPLDSSNPFIVKVPGFGTMDGGFGAKIRKKSPQRHEVHKE